MTAASATLAFLPPCGCSSVVGAMVLEESGGKILAALKGQVDAHPALTTPPVRLRHRAARSAAPMRATPRLRAAA